jgi:hypothetical protein
MEIPVLLEPIENNGYRATSLAPPSAVAEAPTREAALEELREMLCGKLSHAEVVRLQVPLAGDSHPWATMAGTWKNHPDAAEFEQNIHDYRRQVDSDEQRQ